MAKLMSKKTKEIVQTVTVLVLVILFIIFYIIAPLVNVPDLMARPEKEEFEDPEYVLANNPSFFVENGLNPDTLTLVSRDNINLATLYFKVDGGAFDSALGLAVLVHAGDTDRTSLLPYIKAILAEGFNVVAYDQRACGLSGGIWHTAGRYEADDLVDLVADLNIHEGLIHPLIAVGFGVGADAAMKASLDESRIDRTILISPFLTGKRWMADRIEKTDVFEIPFANGIYYWWFKKISNFPYDRTSADDLVPLRTPTLLVLNNDALESEAAERLIEITPKEILTVKPYPASEQDLENLIVSALKEK